MKISKLILALGKEMERVGDVDVVIDSTDGEYCPLPINTIKRIKTIIDPLDAKVEIVLRHRV